MKTLMVDANYRFIGAYQELNTRISLRQQALALYVTLVVSLLAALVAFKPQNIRSALPIEWLILGFPVASTFLVFLNYKAERAITNLRQFLSTLEQLNDMNNELPSYNTHPHWAAGANKARRFHDYAAVVLVLGSNLIGLGAAIQIYPARIAQMPITIWFSIIIAIISTIGVLYSPKWGFNPE